VTAPEPTPIEPKPPIEDFEAFLSVIAFGPDTKVNSTTTELTQLGDAGLDSLGLLLVSIVLAGRGAEFTDDDWVGLVTVGELWDTYRFRLTNPAAP